MQITAEHVIAARRELARRSLCDFACMVDIPSAPVTDEEDCDTFGVIRLNSLVAHHKLLLGKLQALERGGPNLMVLMPPGSAKSTYSDVVFVPWFLARQARRNVILASYASDIARKQGRRAKQLIKSASFQALFPGLELKDDQKAADEWGLSNGSEYMAGGLLSGLTGNRAALGILDDPIKGRAEAESETIRSKSWDAYTDDFCSRLIPGAPQVLIQTRWHEDDIAGRILPEGWDGESGLHDGRDGRKWDVICLPAIADRRDDPLGRKLGETLWPEWFSNEHWLPFKKNARTWASLYQQKPTAPEGTFFQRAWFRRYTPDGLPKKLHKYITTDHAPAGKEDSDFNTVRVWGICPDGEIWLLDGRRWQATMEKVVEYTLQMVAKHNPFAWFPEDDNNWKSVSGFVKKEMRKRVNGKMRWVRIEPISPHGADKPTKAQPFQALAEQGSVHIPVGPEGDDVIEQYIKFPAGAHDDEVDAASLIGRAISDAHPAMAASADAARPKEDSWAKAFGDDEDAESDWKTQ